MSPQFMSVRGDGWWGGNEEGGGRHGDEVPENAVPAYAPILLWTWRSLINVLTGFCVCSMICEKQFVPFDDQSLYCSEE